MLLKAAEIKRCKVITLLHDIDSQRTAHKSESQESKLFNRSYAVIAHNKAMITFLKEQGVTSDLISLEIFDYLFDGQSNEAIASDTDGRYKVVYAGGLSTRKNNFIYELYKLKSNSLSFRLYGPGYSEELSPNNVENTEYMGVFSPEEVVEKIEGSFGLVWDGASIDTCAGPFGEYSYNFV